MAGPIERKLAAILSADVVGYSRLMAEDEAATIRTLTDHREEIARRVRQHRGRVVDTPGDNLLAEFPTAFDAVRCAVEVQEALRALNANVTDERRMDFRIGIHMGDVSMEGERIYGDGVNIAARLESLAEPGRVCISGAVHEQVRRKLEAAYVDLGEQQVKNIPDPVRVWQIDPSGKPPPAGTRLRRALLVAAVLLLLLAAGLWSNWPRPLGLVLAFTGAAAPPVNPPLPDKPSLVVLPFENMSGDPEQEYFSDGMTEDLITDLSRSPRLFVIARNSAFTYKGRAVNVEEVGHELGVRYVVEGSVRRDANRIRVTAQLIDAATGFHVWSERYDRELTDLFAVQSELAERIMVGVGGEIRAAEVERIRRRPTESLSAHDLVLKATHYYMQFTREDHDRARELLERAIELDPEYARAHAMLSGILLNAHGNLWSLDPTLMDKALEQADLALAIDRSDSHALVHKALVLVPLGRAEEALPYAECAVELDPNWDVPHTALAFAKIQSGDPIGALQSVSRGLRRNPRPPAGDLFGIALINHGAGRTDVALEILERIRATNPDLTMARLQLMILYASQGRDEKLPALVREVLRVNPELTAEHLMGLNLYTQIVGLDDLGGFIQKLRRAGLP